LVVTPQNEAPYTISIREEGGKIIGQGVSVRGDSTKIYLERVGGTGLQGYAMGHFFDLDCSQKFCDERGASDLHFALAHVDKELAFDGHMSEQKVRALLGEERIGVAADGSYGMYKTAEGTYAGSGSFTFPVPKNFNIELKSQGSLKGVKDPAVFIVLMVSPFVR
jgi:hypothetical protein